MFRNSTLLILFITSSMWCFGQPSFQQAYQANSLVPPGLLEAVSWTNTHMVHLNGNTESCSGLPQAYGIMGLHSGGKYFNQTGDLAAEWSGISVEQQKSSANSQMMAYAILFNTFMIEELQNNGGVHTSPTTIRQVLHQISEIPNDGFVNLYARDAQVYSILKFMMDADKAQTYGFARANYDLAEVFGASNYDVLSSKKVVFTQNEIKSKELGSSYIPEVYKSLEYGPAIWNPAASCNFSSRNGIAVSAITVHTIQGTYAGAISWAQNCAAGVSYHYVIRSSDGQVTQMVQEADKGWHVGSENPYTIGYEHEGYVNDPSWYTDEMYESSADLSRDVINSGYGIPGIRTYYGASSATTQLLGNCTKIKGHQHYANQTHTDPGINWDWERYYRLINNTPSISTINSASGNFYDSGGNLNDYSDDERELWLFEPLNGATVTLDFTVFDIEVGYDQLFIYDGDTIGAPLIGSFTGTNSPGIITSTGNSLLVEFRSDCGTTSSGWEATYSSVPLDQTPPLTNIQSSTNWLTDDFMVDFVDTDSIGFISERFYLNAIKSPTANSWASAVGYGFVHEEFEDNSNNWNSSVGSFSLNNGGYSFLDTAEQNSNTFYYVDQDQTVQYLFEWDQNITGNASNQRAGMHFFCDNPTLPNRGNSYFIYLRESSNKVQIYNVVNDNFSLQTESDVNINAGQWYNCKTWYNPTTGNIKVFIDDSLVASWQDPSPLLSGNSISLRSGGCEVQYDNVRVYKSRGTSVSITAGPNDEFYIESEGAIETGLVRSIVIDNSDNWSQPDIQHFLLDFTPPTVNYVHDGPSLDIDTLTTNLIEANWAIDDIHSSIQYFEVAVGTLPQLDDVHPWTNSGIASVYSAVLSNPNYNEVYHVSIRAYNNADLSEIFISDGQQYLDNLGINDLDNFEEIDVYPNPAKNNINFSALPSNSTISIFNQSGQLCSTKKMNGDLTFDISSLANGSYNLIIESSSNFVVKKIVIKN